MNSRVERRKGAFRFAMERALAPHVEEAWAESFVLELRLLGVAGDRIGAALSEVESHCADGGESAGESFGDPVGYARSLHLPESADQSPRAVIREILPIGVQLAGMFAINGSFDPWLSGEPLGITVGHAVSVVVTALALGAFVRFSDPVLRAVVYHPVRFGLGLWLALVASLGAAVAAPLLLDSTLWRIPAELGLAAGGAVLAGGVVWAYRRWRATGGLTDLITSPMAPSSVATNPRATSRLGRLLESPALARATSVAMIPIGTVLLLGLTVVLRLAIGES